MPERLPPTGFKFTQLHVVTSQCNVISCALRAHRSKINWIQTPETDLKKFSVSSLCVHLQLAIVLRVVWCSFVVTLLCELNAAKFLDLKLCSNPVMWTQKCVLNLHPRHFCTLFSIFCRGVGVSWEDGRWVKKGACVAHPLLGGSQGMLSKTAPLPSPSPTSRAVILPHKLYEQVSGALLL